MTSRAPSCEHTKACRKALHPPRSAAAASHHAARAPDRPRQCSRLFDRAEARAVAVEACVRLESTQSKKIVRTVEQKFRTRPTTYRPTAGMGARAVSSAESTRRESRSRDSLP